MTVLNLLLEAHKLLSLLRQQAAEMNTHSENFLRLPSCSHVGVMDLFEDHPGFVVLPHLTKGNVSRGERQGEKI